MNPVSTWLDWLAPDERREAERHESLPLIAYYWDGSPPVAHCIRDSSSTGLYLLTEQRWYPGTVITMRLQSTAVVAGRPGHSIAVNARVIRSGADGVGFEFELPEKNTALRTKCLPPNEANRKTLRRFFERLRADTRERVAKRLRDESGQVMVLTVLSMAVLLGFAAFATDVGILLYTRRVMQTAADSAAIAGAAEIRFNDVTAAAQTDAAQNGVTNGINGAAVAVNNGPLSGPHAGNTSYVEVIVSQPQPTFFMKIFNRGSMTVGARAVATVVPNPTCIYTLSQTPVGGSGVSLSNGASLTAPACGISDDATGSNALSVVDASISARSVGVAGGVYTTGGSITPNPITPIIPVSDPLSALSPPSGPFSCIANPNIGGTSSQTLGPATPGGTVCYNGLSITGTGTVTLTPGLYIINGTMSFNTSGTISGAGVTFYFPPGAGSFTDNGGETLNLSATAGGPYDGILFYQDATDTQSMTFAAHTGAINGIFYLPAAQLSLSGGGSTTFNISLVVGSLSLTGNSAYSFTPYVSVALAPPLPTPILVE